MKIKQIIMGLIVFVVAGCGGNSSDSDNTTTGIFYDSPVMNIGYRTQTKEGITNSLGEYEYVPGESVTFFIGNLTFPTVQATGVLTPLDLANSINTSDPIVVNMIRLLQTLDKNGIHDDGIEITDTAKSVATQIDFNISVSEFESSLAVLELIRNAGQETAVTELISEAVAIQNFEESLDENYSVNLTEITASSLINTSECPYITGGWEYVFTETSMTLTGTDSWMEPACILSAEESVNVEMIILATDYDIPFNCESYPVCTSADFNKTISGIDEDNNEFTSTYTFDRANRKITYTKTVDTTTFTETIVLHDNFSINVNGQHASSVIINSECPATPGGWDYVFYDTSMNLTGSDGWQDECTLFPEESFDIDMTNLEDDYDIPFNCKLYPICTSAELNKRIVGLDDDDRDFISTYSFDRENEILTYIKTVNITSLNMTIFTEVISIQ